MTETDFDVVIIGGGPAGSSMACYLAKAGIDCVVMEREIFPREHVGESLVPSSTKVFRDLDFIPTMEEAGFPHKYGAAWTAASTSRVFDHNFEGMQLEDHADFDFAEREQEGVNQPYTYHVDRAKFDNLLLHHAKKLGAQVMNGVGVKKVDFSNPDLVTLKIGMGRRDMEVTTKLVVDASGRRTMVGNQMKWRIKDDVFDQYAIHSWFEDYDRSVMAYRDGQEEFIFIHFLPISNTWIWQIPITDKITSIGVVTQKKNFSKSRESREAFFWECLESRPELFKGVKASKQLRPFKDEGEYSYAMKEITGDRLVMIGDAARFVDPIFSTGVSIALTSSRFASRDIIDAFKNDDLSKASFQDYETTIRRGTRNWYNFISVYYRLNILFTAFVNHPKYRLDVLKLLQGDVYDEDEPEVLGKMREIVTDVERNEDHLWHKLLGDLTSNVFADTFSVR